MKHREAAEYIARRLKDLQSAEVEQVFLYGSVARGEAKPESDVDIVVVARSFRPTFTALRKILAELIVLDAPLVSTVVLTSDEFRSLERRRALFYRTLMREGELLVA